MHIGTYYMSLITWHLYYKACAQSIIAWLSQEYLEPKHEGSKNDSKRLLISDKSIYRNKMID